MKRLFVGAVACAALAFLLAACEPSAAPGGGGGGNQGLAADVQARAQDIAEASVLLGQLGQVFAGVFRSSIVGLSDPSAPANFQPYPLDQLRTNLTGIFGANAVTAQQNGTTLTLTFINASFYGGPVKVNGTITAEVQANLLTIRFQTSLNLTLGPTTVVLDAATPITFGQPKPNCWTFAGPLRLSRGDHGLSLTVENTGLAADASNSVGISGTVKPVSGGVTINATMTNLVLPKTSAYPASGSVGYLDGGVVMTITFNGTATASVVDEFNKGGTVSLPPAA